ncbi:MAG: hypothetical protein AABZ47_13290 [Planctomycetota bacterium]
MTAALKLPPEPNSKPSNQAAGRPALEPLAVDAKALAALIGISVRTVRTHDAGGKLPRGIKIGGRKVWIVDEIKRWLVAGAPDRVAWEARKAALESKGGAGKCG